MNSSALRPAISAQDVTPRVEFRGKAQEVMRIMLNFDWLLLIPFGLAEAFFAWVLWNVSQQLRREKLERHRRR
jgi:hypothetical protein